MEKAGYVYLLTNRNHSVIYTGVTSDLVGRIAEHQQGSVEGFTKKYAVDRLVYFEACGDIGAAIAREKQLKAGSRKSKEELIKSMNPGWLDLSQSLV